MNIALFTSNHLRHRYIATELAKELSLKLILCEEKSTAIEDTSKYIEEDVLLLNNHFKKRKASEQHFFSAYLNFPRNIALINLKFGTLNSQVTLELLKEYDIDCILLFGTSIIKSLILEKYPSKIINLHLGLSPYYKGSGTNFFPIVNNEFECLGATIHLAIAEVDAGSILHQIRLSDISIDDDIYSLGNKIIQKAGKIYPQIVKNYLIGKIKPHVQVSVENSKVYKLKDFTPDALRKAITSIENNSISKFLKIKEQKIALKPIIINYNE